MTSSESNIVNQSSAAGGDWLAGVIRSSLEAAAAWNADGEIVYANGRARPIVEHLELPESDQLQNAIMSCLKKEQTLYEKISIPWQESYLILDLALMPVRIAAGLHVLLLARDGTLEHNLSNALMASRRLFKELVACSSDFTWETRADGTFSYVSPRGAIGFEAIELNGKLGRELIHEVGREISPNPSESHRELSDEEVLLKDAREQLVQRVVDAIHSEVTPESMLATAAQLLAEALNVPHCWILREERPAGLKAVADVGKGTALEGDIADIVAQMTAYSSKDEWLESERGDLWMFIVRCGHRDTNKGYAVAARSKTFGPWSDDERALMTGVAAHIGVVIAQSEVQERLVRLSRTDELAGLYNRRAFDDEVTIRLARVQRTGRPGALLYFDLDNFKAVNDARGHADGDAVLIDFALMLKNSSRTIDLTARIGGDEFAMWLDDAVAGQAMSKARAVRREFGELDHEPGRRLKPLGVSIGIAIAEADQTNDLKTLYAISDAALYKIKRGGKSDALVGTLDTITEVGEK